MGTVFNRGTNDKPNWVYKPSRQATKAHAKRWVQEIESSIARSQGGIEDDDDAPAFKPVFDAFLEGLTNRNAADDRSRGRREDCAEFLGPWIEQREAQGAGPEAPVFPCARRKGLSYRKEYIESCWEEAAPKHVGAREVLLKPTMTWYPATRHGFVTRHLSRGASLDEVSAAVGHSSPMVTKRFYDHYVRRTFSPKLRAGLGLGAKQEGRVVPMRKSR